MMGLVLRVTDRAVRTWPLGEWALLRRVLPDGGSTAPDPRRFMPDKGSSLALDDLDFMPELGAHVVSSTARFPVMNAAENLVGAGQVGVSDIPGEQNQRCRRGNLVSSRS